MLAKDLYEAPRLAVQGALAWSTPELYWRPLCRLFGSVYARGHPSETRRLARVIQRVLAGRAAAVNAGRFAVDHWANRYEERFQYLRAWRPGGWQPAIDISGRGHVDAALASGRGIVFWSGKFAFSALVGKIALHRLGLAVAHFSRPYHGFSTSRFGIRYLNPVRRRPESWYLDKRLMVPEDETRQALEWMRRRLQSGGAVSFTIGDRGRRVARAPLLGAVIELATGPVTLGRRTGAIVLPLSTLRTTPGRYAVDIGAPLALTCDRAGYGAGIQSLAESMAPHILRDPGQWRGWRYIRDESAARP